MAAIVQRWMAASRARPRGYRRNESEGSIVGRAQDPADRVAGCAAADAQPEWNALVARNETNYAVFQTYEWFDAWWQSPGRNRRLFFLVVRNGADIVGFAPLMLRRTIAGLRQMEFIGTGNADYQDFVLPIDKPAALLAICSFLRENASRWDRLRLTNVPRADRRRWRLLTEAARVCGFGFVEGDRRFDVRFCCSRDTREAARELIDRYSMRRPLNWFSARGACAVVT